MSEMSSWKYLASSRLSSFKGYIAQQDLKNSAPNQIQRLRPDSPGISGEKQSWRQWAGQKLTRRGSGNSTPKGNLRVALFPGWAARRYENEASDSFVIEVFVSGFATVHSAPDAISRSQRAFMRLAKGFAALPKLENPAEPSTPMVSTSLTPSTEELLASVHLPPRPDEMTKESEIEELERQFLKLNQQSHSEPSTSRTPSPSSSVDSLDVNIEGPSPVEDMGLPPSIAAIGEDLRKLHANLESRLRHFWSSTLPNRAIRINVFAHPNGQEPNSSDHGSLRTEDVTTAADGSFQARFRVPWDEIVQHPAALHIAFGDPLEEHDLVVTAEILPPPLSQLIPAPPNETSNPSSSIRVSLTHAPIRVISDIDDTVKHSGVLLGARAVFRNVFVKELADLVIPGVGEWYTRMWERGARFHYVSNGPFEYVHVLGNFFEIAGLPAGSLKLKSYAGRSLFSGLLSAPAARKRAGILELLEAFPDSKFILIGDSGEQDMELYSQFASERPDQILAIFIRQADELAPPDDPIGYEALVDPQLRAILMSGTATTPGASKASSIRSFSQGSTAGSVNAIPSTHSSPSAQRQQGADYFTQTRFTSEPEQFTSTPPSIDSTPNSYNDITPKSSSTSSSLSSVSRRAAALIKQVPPRLGSSNNASYVNMPEEMKKRYELQWRIYRARLLAPPHIPFRVFKEPAECIEADSLFQNHTT